MTEPTFMGSNRSGNEDLKQVITRIGTLMRTLRESMRELGLEKSVQQAVASIPDGKDRLRYIAQMTAQAAEKTLNGIDVIKPLQVEMNKDAIVLQQQWQDCTADTVPVELRQSTQAFLGQVIQDSEITKAELLEIMMAQDFQDLTGQVIKKMMEVVEEAEKQLLALLVENTPPEMRAKQQNDSLLNGPQINKEGVNVMASQSQVDDLLDELGF
ncbi:MULTISPECIES: protein phosphatase CheZ [Providencia]|uniref:Protein phosphatase CheZ n=1 Tax=Providencia heimbachae ATCC 35613 TaxID=1354272 RepID=A0A1B7K068_9GAMM|nr:MULTISPECIES: protein phosphatase CheZ [Providencia]MBP6120746.1 protein phosphatase CheZ [Providencia sp.]MDD9341373.1 protein phosphatase CheZ [Providencia heimbachae]NIH23206.1 protein phosphatase CheZ [Providencia heimbachae]OAT53547.1 CheZ family phosphatase [Providencia heimbachae ATCC 35613]QCJ70718.1 protein phosphatase CheZ [Providencia heimbachae]